MGGIINYAESNAFQSFIVSFGKTLSIMEDMTKAHQLLLNTGNELTTLAGRVASAEAEYIREENNVTKPKLYSPI